LPTAAGCPTAAGRDTGATGAGVATLEQHYNEHAEVTRLAHDLFGISNSDVATIVGVIKSRPESHFASQEALALSQLVDNPAYSARVGALRGRVGRGSRSQAQARLGTAFELREFNHVILEEGVVPLGELPRQVEDWVSRVSGHRP
jgi:hypothetical protein